MNKKVLFSTLWIFVTVNYIFCDILTLFHSESLKQLMTGEMGGMKINQSFLLSFSILMEMPIVMIVLSRILSYRSNRLANIIVALIMTLVQAATLFTADNTMHYIFFSIIEVGTTSFILYSAWNWVESKNIE
jgi:Sec-independent protein secretion pathway component TatC